VVYLKVEITPEFHHTSRNILNRIQDIRKSKSAMALSVPLQTQIGRRPLTDIRENAEIDRSTEITNFTSWFSDVS
jgi:hypothetical protein